MGKKRKKKVRVEFQKNRALRHKRLTSRMLEDQPDAARSSERVSGKGDVTRHRTVIVEEGAESAALRNVDESKCLSGRVITALGADNCQVYGEDGRRYRCTVRRVVRTLAREARNAVVAGDRVLFQPAGEGQGVIERVEPRQGVLSRGSQRQQHILVANVTQVLIVTSALEPPLKPSLIDRFIISAEKGGVHSTVCINKADLVDPADLQPVLGIYSRLGYSVVLTSTATGAGIPRLRSLLHDQETVLAGQSGVGKSSLLNAVQPGLALRTGEVSRTSQKGRHTTRAASLVELEFGGWVVDTPGIRQLELWDVTPEEVEGHFVEFRPFVTFCKFPNCMHVREAGCGVKAALQRDLISEQRYESYLNIVLGDFPDLD